MWKMLCKNILALYRYRDFRVGIFYFASPCRRETDVEPLNSSTLKTWV